ncbi:phosphate acyltransferase PlsX [soil metagenome]
MSLSPTSQITLSIDAMGGDHGPPVIVAGAELALRRFGARPVRLLLHGDEAAIEAELKRHPAVRSQVEVRHTEKRITGEEKAAQAMRRGKGSSLWNAVEAVKTGEAHAAVSGGNTGALMAISRLLLRMIGELERPALVASWPTLRGVSDVLDVGANIEVDARQLVEFAIMGAAFHAAVNAAEGAMRPSIGLLNVGSEDQKGHEYLREAHRLLKENTLGLNYHGFVEGDDIARGVVDVIVTDGFTGNVALKTGEGLAKFFTQVLRESLTSGPLPMAGAFLAQGALRDMRARLTPPGGGPLLGLKGVVVKSHGGADAAGFADALRIAAELASSDFAEEIARDMARFGATMGAAPPVAAEASAEPAA